jgi:hypothetical protein
MGWYGLDQSGSGEEPEESPCEHGNELSGFHKMLGNSLITPQLAAAHEGLSFLSK